MSDLSNPPLSLLPSEAAGFCWPTPEVPGYPGPRPTGEMGEILACEVEGINGKVIAGFLTLFSPELGRLELRLASTRTPMALRFDQFRRVRLVRPLAPLAGASSTGPQAELLAVRPALPFFVDFNGAPRWSGETIGHRDEAWGLFLFEPVDSDGAVQRLFVPRSAYRHAEVGLRLGQALVAQNAATPEQVDEALAEQLALRKRKLGDLLLVRQIITADALRQAIEQQASMPMVRIGEALTALGFITEVQLEEALIQQRSDRSVPLGELLVRKRLISRADLQTALARKMGYPLVDLSKFPVDTEAVSRLPHTVASRVHALPLMMHAGRMVTALEDPTDRRAIEEIEFAAQCKLVPVLARNSTMLGAIEMAYERVGMTGLSGRITDLSAAIDFEANDPTALLATMVKVETRSDDDGDGDEDSIEQSDNSLVRLINSMVLEAQAQGVSDIHVECPPGREKVRIRFRKDGQLRPYLELPISYRSAVIARLKIMCDLDITERRKAQDGKINFSKFVQGSRLELRLATIPTHSTLEDAVLRLLSSSKPVPLESLDLSPRNLERFKEAVQRPHGMILCVGPTGSGKTTTLHSALSLINTAERKIWTAEDPIEITQEGLRQVQINPRIEWTFSKALRSFLRADPDVIMVGEIRDQETAQVVIESSLTGHLVLSTLHTNSAPETVTRLLDMGMDPFNFADALLGILAQRLVRRLCTACRVERCASAEEEEELLHDYMRVMDAVPATPDPDDVLADWRRRFGREGRLSLYKSVGCEPCSQSGFRGRAGIHELMIISRELRHLIQTGARADELQRQALGDGMRTLRQDGIDKVLAGVTSIEEVRAKS